MRRLGWLGLITALAIPAGPALAQAQAKADAADLQCLAVAFMLVGSKDQTAQQIGMMTSLYYLGKLDGKTPAAELEQPIYDQLTKLTPETADPIAKRCGAELQARGASLTEIGNRLEKREAAAAQPKPQ